MPLLLGLLGAAAGHFAGFAAVGWFIGSTIGSLLSIENETVKTSSSGPRLTEFRAMASRYGLIINRGFGTARYNGNLIWAAPIDEREHIERTVVKQKVGGFLGFFSKTHKSVTEVHTYHYTASFAVAFAEGEAEQVTKIWARGELIYNLGDTNIVQTAADSAASGRPISNAGTGTAEGPAQNLTTIPLTEFKTEVASPNITIYRGTLTQPANSTIASIEGEENTPAYRNLVYVVVKDLDLELFGFAVPELTAEIVFSDTESYPSHLITWPSTSDGYQTLVFPQPDLNGLPTVYTTGAPFDRTITEIDAYTGNVEVVYDYADLFDDEGIIETNELEYGFVDHDGLHYFSAFKLPPALLVAVDPATHKIVFRGDVVSTVDVQGPIMWLVHDEIRGYSYGLTTRGDFVVVSKPPNVLLPTTDLQEDASAFAVQGEFVVKFIYEGLTGIDLDGDMASIGVLDKNGTLWIAVRTASLTSPPGYQGATRVFSYNPDDDSTWISDWLVDNTQSPPMNVVVQSGDIYLTYVTTDHSLIISHHLGHFKYDIESDAITKFLSGNPPAVGGGLRQKPNYAFGPYGDKLYYQIGLYYVELDAVSLEVIDWWGEDKWTEHPGQAHLYGMYNPHMHAFVSVSPDTGLFWDYLRTGQQGVGLDTVVSDLILKDSVISSRFGITASDIDVTDLAANTVRGYPIISQQAIRGALAPLQQAHFFDYYESDQKIRFRLRGRPAIVNITEAELASGEVTDGEGGSAAGGNDVRLGISRQEELEVPREVVVNHINPDKNYDTGTQRSRVEHSTLGTSNTDLSLPLVLSSVEAKGIAEVLHESAIRERNTYQFQLPPKYMYLDPTDIVTITMDSGTVHTLRLASVIIGQNGVVQCEGVPEVTSAYEADEAKADDGLGGVANVYHAPREAVAINQHDLPAVPSSGPVVVGGAVNVSVLARSISANSTYTLLMQVGTGPLEYAGTVQKSNWGFVSDFPVHSEGADYTSATIDNETSITIRTTGALGVFSSITEDALYTGLTNKIVIGDEIIGFTTVTANSPDDGVYVLTGIVRGMHGTEHAIDRHVSFTNMNWVALEDVQRIAIPDEAIGKIISVFVKPTGSSQKYRTVSFEYGGASLAPLGPSDVTVSTSGSPIDLIFSWRRRDRLSKGWPQSEIANSEGTEQYEIDILDRDETVLRTLTVEDATTLTYTNSQILTDFTTFPESFKAKVYQLSTLIGRGWPTRAYLRYNEPHYETDFTTDVDSPPAAPSDWTERWDAANGSLVVSSNAVLTIDQTSGTYAASWDAVGDVHDVETLIKVKFTARTSSGDDGFRLYARGRGETGSPLTKRGYFFYISEGLDAMGIGEYYGTEVDGADSERIFTTLDFDNIVGIKEYITPNDYIDADTWMWVRFKVQGFRFQAKLWLDGIAEPSDWQLETEQPVGHDWGWFGLGTNLSSTEPQVDQLFVAADGHRA